MKILEQKKQLFVSHAMMTAIKKLQEVNPKSISYGSYSFPVLANPLFPFEICYDACDVETKQETKIGSGEWCHGALVPVFGLSIERPDLHFAPTTKEVFMHRNSEIF